MLPADRWRARVVAPLLVVIGLALSTIIAPALPRYSVGSDRTNPWTPTDVSGGAPSGVSRGLVPGGLIGAWSATTNYPTGVGGQSCIASGGYMYCVGGTNFYGGTYAAGTFSNAVSFAPITPSGIGAWSNSTPYPFPVAAESCFSSLGFIYCVGGGTASPSYNYLTSAVYYAPLSPSGVGPWTATTPYPTSIYGESCVASGGYVYCLLGQRQYGGATNASYFAPLSASGGVGPWVPTTSYPVAALAASCVASGGFVYCTLGSTLYVNVGNATYYAPLSPAGIGLWSSTTRAPWSNGFGVAAFAVGGFMYIVGGCVSPQPACFTGSVFYTQLSKSGVGSWIGTAPLPAGGYEACVANAPYIYCIAGFPSTGAAFYARSSLTSPCSAPISPPSGSSVSVGSAPEGLAYDSANGNVYVANAHSDNVTVINGITDAVNATVTVGQGPVAVAADSADGEVYVANGISDNVTVLDGSTDKVLRSTPVGSFPRSVAYDSANGNVYVVDDGDNNVTVLNGTTGKVVGSVTVGFEPQLIAFDRLNGYLYVTMHVGVVVINGSSGSVVGSLPTGTYPSPVGVDTSNGRVYVGNSASGNVTVINGSRDTVVGSVPVGDAPSGIAYDGTNGQVYVANEVSDNVTVVSAATDRPVGSVPVGSSPLDATYDSANGCIYVANSGSDNVTVINGQPSFSVTFTESGLPSGTEWLVNISGQPSLRSTTTTISTSLPNGSYAYAVATLDKDYHAMGGLFGVAGAPVSQSVVFSPFTYVVTFSETGLPGGTSWTVTLAGVPSTSTGTTNGFIEPNGSYAYTVSPIPGYTVSPRSGTAVVRGADLDVGLVFTQATYAVTFNDPGLPPGTTWYVNVTGALDVSLSGTGTQLSAMLPNGSYTFKVGTMDKRLAAPGGAFVVSGARVSETVTFGLVTYTLTFTESGPTLTKGQTKTFAKKGWTVVLNGTSMHSTGTTISYSDLPNGTYPVLITGPSGYDLTGTGTVTVKGTTGVSVTVTKGKTYMLTFKEKGLKHKPSWCVTVDGYEVCTTKSSLKFVDLTPGTYSYTVQTATGYTVTPTSGSIPLTSSTVVTLTFTRG